jgi:hypothetical protein
MQNSMAILTPRLVEEEMFAVATRAGAEGERPNAERLSIFPSYRMFPLQNWQVSYRIEQFADGWRITNITGGNGEIILRIGPG